MRILVAVLMMGLTAGAQARVMCKQFATQAEAQAYMQQHGARYLDRDHDGIACEHLRGGKRHKVKKARKAYKTKTHHTTGKSGSVSKTNNPFTR